MNKINNVALLKQLFVRTPDVANVFDGTIPYLKVTPQGTALFVRCPNIDSIKSLLLAQEKIATKISNLFAYEVIIECEQLSVAKLEKSVVGNNMVATIESVSQNRTSNLNNSSQTKLFKLDILAATTGLSSEEIKKILAQIGGVIYPRVDGSEMVAESSFDSILLGWAKSLKDGAGEVLEEQQNNEILTPLPKKPPKQGVRVMKSELTIDDIARYKGGKLSGSPNLTDKALQETIAKFFGKVKLDDTTLVDAISSFIEGTSELGQALRKKLTSAYRKFFPGANVSEIENKLIASAKTYLESLASLAQESPTEA